MVRRVAVGHVHLISCSRASIAIFSWKEGAQLAVKEEDVKTQDFLFGGRSTPCRLVAQFSLPSAKLAGEGGDASDQ